MPFRSALTVSLVVLRAGKTTLVGTVAHECSLTPSIQSADASAAYARILRERQRKAAEPRSTLKMLDVDKAQANRMASGMGTAGLKGRVATFAVRRSLSLSLSLSNAGPARPLTVQLS